MLTLITVNYNCADKTLALLRSLERQTDTNFDVIVVDNDSTADDRTALGEYAASSPLRLDVIYNDTNRGFSGGNNVAIRKAMAQKASWILLINPDTTVAEGFIGAVRARLPAEPAVVGLAINEGTQTAYAGIVTWLKATMPHRYYPVPAQGERSQVLYAIGAAVAVPASVFDAIGLLDERYFLYFEDADFSVRARTAGIPIRFLEQPVVSHSVSQSTRKLGRPLLLRYHARNALLFNWSHGPWWVRIALPFGSLFGIILQTAKILLMPSRRAPSRAIAAGIVDFYARRFGKISQENYSRS